ncbi:MAG: hypothetical protein WAX04_09945, partial [Oscillospiraceae bacterium]
MQKYYINPIQVQEKLPLDSTIYTIGADFANEDSKKVIQYLDRQYELLEEIPDGNCNVIGYIHADIRENLNKKWNGRKLLVAYNMRVFANVYEKPQMRTVGYLKAFKEGEYFEVTRPFIFIPLCILLLLLTLVIALTVIFSSFESIVEKPIFGDDITSQGSVTEDRTQPLTPVYFNVKINATPILENGKMNIRIENSSRNIYSCHVKVTAYIKGEKKTIYNSPLIEPNHLMEYATIDESLVKGSYDGKAV